MNRFWIALAVAAFNAWAGFCGWIGYEHGKAGVKAWLDNLLEQTSIVGHFPSQSLLFDH